MTLSVIGVGSNINPRENIDKARSILSSEKDMINESKFIQTAPVGYENQPDFVNGTFLISVDSDLEDFRKYLKEVERRIGRIKSNNKYAPRIIDLDIVVWDGKIIDDDFYDRDFVKKSTLEVLPQLKY